MRAKPVSSECSCKGFTTGYTLHELSFECRSASKQDSRLAAAAKDLVQLPVDVIVTSSQPAAHAAQGATDAIPIVTIISGDPVAAGLARSLAKPRAISRASLITPPN